jgi:hypothetical protein
MELEIVRVDVWAAGIEDKPGALAGKLAGLASAGVNLEFIVARRTAEKPGQGVVFATPIEGPAQMKAAKEAGFQKAESMHSVRVAAPDEPGLGAILARQIADAGINLRGVSAASIGKNAVFYLAFDSAEDASKAIACLGQLG